ncbi:MAG TPA: energy-coupling factor ABC transporter permease [Polyangia bacterium]|jgi:cobalt/nickel transport system permease protein
MHLPDGFLRPAVWAPLCGAGALLVGCAARAVRRGLAEDRVPLMGVLGAFLFAAQLVNVPVGPGVSGHLVGTVLLTVLLGWAPAVLTMTAILLVQALVLQDGGLTALGANVLNLAVAPALLAALLLRLAPDPGPRRTAVAGVAAWVAVMVSATLVAVELSLSGQVRLGAALWTLGLVHAPIGVLEAILTVLLLRFAVALRPDLAARAQQA